MDRLSESVDDVLEHLVVPGAVHGGLGVEGDSLFHHAVHRAGNNKVLEHVIDGLAEAIHETRIESLSEPDRPKNSLRAHRRILSAIEAQQPAGAADAMRAHVREVSDVALLRWEPPVGDDAG